jgi:hypothetical protein
MNHDVNSNAAAAKRRWKWLPVTAGLLLALVIAGYISNNFTMRTCEQQVARWLKDDVMRGGKFYVLSHDATPEALAIFDEAGGGYTVYVDTSTTFDGFPWCYVRRAQNGLPFIVTVESGWQLAPLYGSGQARRFLCIFGISIPLGDDINWVS